MEFIKDCVSNKMSLNDIATKYGIEPDKVLERYYEERAKYTLGELLDAVLEVYDKDVE